MAANNAVIGRYKPFIIVMPADASPKFIYLVPKKIWEQGVSPLYSVLDSGHVCTYKVRAPNRGRIVRIWCDEEGKHRHKPINEIATALLWDSVGYSGGPLVGAVAFEMSDINQNELGWSDMLLAGVHRDFPTFVLDPELHYYKEPS